MNILGNIVKSHILQISAHYKSVYVDKFVIMPNHIHLIIVLDNDSVKTNMNQVIGQLKSGVSREIHKLIPEMEVWQRSFHDHIIRDQNSYEKIWLYIESNPVNWNKDCFFVDPSMGSAQ